MIRDKYYLNLQETAGKVDNRRRACIMHLLEKETEDLCLSPQDKMEEAPIDMLGALTEEEAFAKVHNASRSHLILLGSYEALLVHHPEVAISMAKIRDLAANCRT